MLRVEESAQKRLEETRAFADKVGARNELEEQLEYLGGYANSPEEQKTVCLLYTDFAPYSFGFTMYRLVSEDGQKKEKRWFNGGLIYYGPGDTGVDGPQFSVSLEGAFGVGRANKHRWEVNT